MNPLSEHCGTITVLGKEYQVRRLTLEDSFTLIQLLSDVAEIGQQEMALVAELAKSGDSEESQIKMSTIIMRAITKQEVRTKTLDFLGSFIGVDAETLAKMPPNAVTGIIRKIFETEDMKSFFDDIRSITQAAMPWRAGKTQ